MRVERLIDGSTLKRRIRKEEGIVRAGSSSTRGGAPCSWQQRVPQPWPGHRCRSVKERDTRQQSRRRQETTRAQSEQGSSTTTFPAGAAIVSALVCISCHRVFALCCSRRRAQQRCQGQVIQRGHSRVWTGTSCPRAASTARDLSKRKCMHTSVEPTLAGDNTFKESEQQQHT